jgi:hypothetical protein
MKLFLAYMLFCSIVGVLMRRQALHMRMWVLFGVCILITIGYFFFNQI